MAKPHRARAGTPLAEGMDRTEHREMPANRHQPRRQGAGDRRAAGRRAGKCGAASARWRADAAPAAAPRSVPRAAAGPMLVQEQDPVECGTRTVVRPADAAMARSTHGRHRLPSDIELSTSGTAMPADLQATSSTACRAPRSSPRCAVRWGFLVEELLVQQRQQRAVAVTLERHGHQRLPVRRGSPPRPGEHQSLSRARPRGRCR